jgi:hypothetical protein
MKTTQSLIAALALGVTAFTTACNKDDNNSSGGVSGSAQVTMNLKDGPAAYDALYLDIQQVQIMTDANGTINVPVARPGRYNILNFRNGLDTLLLQTTLPAGRISQMRLILGPNNSVVVGGTAYPLSTPSAQESGIKLNLDQTLAANGAYTFWIDFDAAKSVLQTGNGQYKLKPVMRAYSAQTNGRIQGYVLPYISATTVYAINGADTFSAMPASNGFFRIDGLPQGNYNVWYDASAGTFRDTTRANVQVTYGQITDLGSLTLLP